MQICSFFVKNYAIRAMTRDIITIAIGIILSILTIKSSFSGIVGSFKEKIEFMSTNVFKFQFYEYTNCKKKVNKLKL